MLTAQTGFPGKGGVKTNTLPGVLDGWPSLSGRWARGAGKDVCGV